MEVAVSDRKLEQRFAYIAQRNKVPTAKELSYSPMISNVKYKCKKLTLKDYFCNNIQDYIYINFSQIYNSTHVLNKSMKLRSYANMRASRKLSRNRA